MRYGKKAIIALFYAINFSMVKLSTNTEILSVSCFFGVLISRSLALSTSNTLLPPNILHLNLNPILPSFGSSHMPCHLVSLAHHQKHEINKGLTSLNNLHFVDISKRTLSCPHVFLTLFLFLENQQQNKKRGESRRKGIFLNSLILKKSEREVGT